MGTHTEILWRLAEELLSSDEKQRLEALTKSNPRIDASSLHAFDNSLGGPSMSRLSCNNTGRYDVADRSIFRPLQYCGTHFRLAVENNWDDDILWHMRDIIEMSSLHIEGLVKRIGNLPHRPLGRVLRHAIVKGKVNQITWTQIDVYTHIYNDSKHDFNHDKDTHMFSVEDALLAYFVCRKLGMKLYSLASLATDIKIFDKECDGVVVT